jgi:hypothetical protein
VRWRVPNPLRGIERTPGHDSGIACGVASAGQSCCVLAPLALCGSVFVRSSNDSQRPIIDQK